MISQVSILNQKNLVTLWPEVCIFLRPIYQLLRMFIRYSWEAAVGYHSGVHLNHGGSDSFVLFEGHFTLFSPSIIGRSSPSSNPSWQRFRICFSSYVRFWWAVLYVR